MRRVGGRAFVRRLSFESVGTRRILKRPFPFSARQFLVSANGTLLETVIARAFFTRDLLFFRAAEQQIPPLRIRRCVIASTFVAEWRDDSIERRQLNCCRKEDETAIITTACACLGAV